MFDFGLAGCAFAHNGNYCHATHMMEWIQCVFTTLRYNSMRVFFPLCLQCVADTSGGWPGTLIYNNTMLSVGGQLLVIFGYWRQFWVIEKNILRLLGLGWSVFPKYFDILIKDLKSTYHLGGSRFCRKLQQSNSYIINIFSYFATPLYGS